MLPEPGALAIPLDGDGPLHRRLAEGLRRAVRAGALRRGQRLPSTRALAADVGVARGTVVAAYDQLVAEGYLRASHGAGTFVADAVPEDFFRAAEGDGPAPSGAPTSARLAARARDVADAAAPYAVPGPVRPLRPCLAPVDLFPVDLWGRLAASVLRDLPAEALGYGDPQGYGPLREALAAYLGAARGVRCTADQVVVTGGSQQAIRLAAEVLLDPGEAAWVEAPGYGGVRTALAAVGVEAVPVPVDTGGLVMAAGPAGARLAVVAPAHQYPLGVTMGLGRRAELLAWAHETGGWVVEDDYDGEYRYEGAPLETLHALDGGRRVVYVGTVSKVLAPALRVGYLVAPPGLAGAFARARAAADGHGPTLAQATLARFMDDGHFGRHLRRMRRTAERRRDVLVAALAEGGLRVPTPEAGLHLHVPLADDGGAAERAARAGVTVVATGAAPDGPCVHGLALGFAAFREGQIRWAARRLLDVL